MIRPVQFFYATREVKVPKWPTGFRTEPEAREFTACAAHEEELRAKGWELLHRLGPVPGHCPFPHEERSTTCTE